jgi:nucleotide-binding universal stress UspA family protein
MTRILQPEDMETWESTDAGATRFTGELGSGILVGVDGSDPSVAALRFAAELGEKLGLGVHALVVWNYPTLLYGNYYYPESEITPEEDARRVLGATMQAAFGEHAPEWVTGAVQKGRAAEVLIERSKDATMLALGTRGHGGFAGLLLGSVSTECSARAHCPVLVVHDERTPER